MLTSARKEVKEAIKNYIMEHFADYHAEQLEYVNKYNASDKFASIITSTNPGNYKEVCKAILSIYNEEVYKNSMCFKNKPFEGFVYWCSGLCSALDSSYYYNVSAVELLASWLQETDEEKNRYTEEQAENRITQLLYRELLVHAKNFNF